MEEDTSIDRGDFIKMQKTLQFFASWSGRTKLPPNTITNPMEARAYKIGANEGFEEVARVSKKILSEIFGEEVK